MHGLHFTCEATPKIDAENVQFIEFVINKCLPTSVFFGIAYPVDFLSKVSCRKLHYISNVLQNVLQSATFLGNQLYVSIPEEKTTV